MRFLYRTTGLAVLLVILLASMSHSQAPTNDDHDVIVLEGGGVARGRIIENVAGEYIVLEVSNGKTLKIFHDDIQSITDSRNYTPAPPSAVDPSSKSARHHTLRYELSTMVGGHSGFGSTDVLVN